MNLSKLQKLSSVAQFFPLAVFVYVVRSNEFTSSAWSVAFQVGSVAAVAQLAALLYLKAPIHRLIGGANLFLIIGGLGFYFRATPITYLLGELRTAGVILAISVFCTIATFVSSNGVFESEIGSLKLMRRHSYSFLGACTLAFFFSYWSKQSILLGGTLPFAFLILFHRYLRHRITKQLTDNEPAALDS